MRITYILDRPELGGGVKVVFQHAQILQSMGHDVTICAKGKRPSWVTWDGSYVDYSDATPKLASQDLVVATYWTTIEFAEHLQIGPVVHFCQGYEGDYDHLAQQREAIETAYRKPLPAFVVAPHLAEMLEKRFDRQAYLTPPPIDPCFRPALRRAPRRVPRIAVAGIYECAWKGVETALRAISSIRSAGRPCTLVRFSLLPLSPNERNLLTADEYVESAPPHEIAAKLRGCDLLLFPSTSVEGFGLPLLEAMVSKVPAVASAIPSVQFMAGSKVATVTACDDHAFAREATRLLEDSHAWRHARRDGYEAASRFHPEMIARDLEHALQWAKQLIHEPTTS